MKRCILTAAVLIAWLPCAGQDETPKPSGASAVELRSAGVAQAKKEEKQVFLIFGAPGCGWCTYFDKYHADSDVRRVIERHLVLVKVDTVENAGGEDLYREYGKQRGVPAFSILAADGKVLANSGDDGKNIGFPYKPHEVDHYFVALKASCPKLTPSEVDLLATKLKEIGPKKTETP